MKRDRPTPPSLYAIADPAFLTLPLEESVGIMAEAGVQWIQLRSKGRPDRELLARFEGAEEAATRHGSRIWLNDRPDMLALLGGSTVVGVHLGQEDLPAAAARKVVGEGAWIGVSTHDEVDLEAAAADPEVDLIAVGPVFPTGSKPDALSAVGLDLVRKARAGTDKPLVAIGGIRAENLASVFDAGADAVAVLSAICHGDVGLNAARLLTAAAKVGVSA